jgi:Ca2+-binding RTX toxin-like protein
LPEDPAGRRAGIEADGAYYRAILGNAPNALGGAYNPALTGTTGDDVLIGTSGADLIEDVWGDDLIDGGGGDDIIVDWGGSNVLRGGAGNDYIHRANTPLGTIHGDDINTSLIEAGDGDDFVRIDNAYHQRITIDLGTGNDLLSLSPPYIFDSDFRITTGAGADRILLGYAYGDALRSQDGIILVTDFTAGAGGDILDIGGLLKGLLAYTSYAANPFASGHLRLIEDGADVIVRIDLDGNGPADAGWYIRDVARLTNVSVAALTTYNLAGYAQNGVAPGGTTTSGTGAGEWLAADTGGSELYGLGGDDRLNGGVGADLLDGGAGDDVIEGGLGDDLLRGGDGDDVLDDDYGSDTFEGGAGNDTIVLVRPALRPELPATHETITINAGDGNDLVSFARAPREISSQQLRTFTLMIDLGAGDDRLVIPVVLPDMLITLGAGQDHVVVGSLFENTPAIVITDFAAGSAGDVIELDRTVLGSLGWNDLTNPFADGYLLLRQEGADTLIVWDYDGAAGGNQSSIYTIARLLNVTASSLTAFNFGGFAPDASPSAFLPGGGTAGDDLLFGSAGDDVIDGGDGNDRIEERKTGTDILSGGAGDDVIIVAHHNYQQLPLVVTVNGGAGNDRVEIRDNFGRANLDLGSGDDRLELFASPGLGTFITLGTGIDTLTINAGFGSQAGGGLITIADFAAGAGGDRLDWNFFADEKLINYHPSYNPYFIQVEGYNPFLYQDARLVQSGADTLLQLNRNPNSGNTTDYVTFIVFANTNVASFTAYNLNYEIYRPTLEGGAANGTLIGTAAPDVIAGGAGNEHIDGLGGDDVLRGYEGLDVVTGGGGRDRLNGNEGDDSLSGGDDDDWLSGDAGRDIVDGGGGNDIIIDAYGGDTITGGAGDDQIHAMTGDGVSGSVDAGDGNDLVELRASDGALFSLNLGAGDDILHIDRAISGIVLGAGRDTIVFRPPHNLNADMDILDFTPGDGGDIFDLDAYIMGRMANEPAYLLGVLGDFDPFAMGYVELIQVGDSVELYIWREGFSDEDVYSRQNVVRFHNTTLADFTAANFGGADPQAVPNRPILVTDDMTVAAGQVLESVNLAPSAGGSAHLVFRAPSHLGPLDFVNHGTIVTRTTADGMGGATGAYISEWTSGGSFLNAADGRFIVDNAFVTQTGNPADGGSTFGFYTFGKSLAFTNDGYFEVSAAGGIAKGIVAGWDLTQHPIVNNGTFIVTSGYEAWGIDLAQSGSFRNYGSLTVSAGEFAVGVYLRSYSDGQFSNQGEITVTTAPSSPYASIGVYAEHGFGSTYGFSNSGTITADIAFYSGDRDSPSTDNNDVFTNSGTIVGDMVMGDGADRVINSGTIFGYLDLGTRNDVYDGASGLYYGIIDGGTGDDVLLGGGGDEIMLGGYGGDKIYGGDGDDFLAGGRGSDALDGGAGFDVISYADAWMGVSADFALGRVVGSGIDRIRNVEGIIGSAYADTLAGSGGDDTLEGAGGDDTISGAGGADVILGDTGNDTMSGGGGADRFLVSAGDGADLITDFDVQQDRLEIYGFAGATQILQVGTDTRITLSPSQSILLRGVAASSLTGTQLIFDPLPLGQPPPASPPSLDTQVPDGGQGFRLYAGEVAHFVNPGYIHQEGFYLTRDTAVDCHVDGGTSNALISGSLLLEVAKDSGIAKAFFIPFEVTILATGSVEVLTSGAVMAVGVHGGGVLNAGVLRVVSSNSGAPVLDDFDIVGMRPQEAASSAVGSWSSSGQVFINNGTIEVSSTSVSTGVAAYNNSGEENSFWNSGDILVTGGLGSMGVLFQGQGHPVVASRPNLVNSGNIIVTDGTALADSVGLALSFTTGQLSSGPYANSGVTVWNSGLIQADYAVKWYVTQSPDSGGPATIYNTGELRGLIDLSAGVEAIHNRGLITGRIDLREGDDWFDGRGGTQSGGVFGGAGKDTLFGGNAAETIDGGGGDDLIVGGGGADVLSGGTGNDIFHVEAGFGADTITDFTAGTGEDMIRVCGYANYQSVQQQGADTLVRFSATDTILLRNVTAANLTALDFTFSAAALAAPAPIPAAPDQPVSLDFPLPFDEPVAFAPTPPVNLVGTPGPDTLTGGDGNDTLNGLGAADVLVGKDGDDTYLVDNAGDVIVERASEGRDVVYASASYSLGAGVSVEVLSVASQSATTALTLAGNELNQNIYGNGGNNLLQGGGGSDYLVGLGGDDAYIVASSNDRIVETAGGGRDVVYALASYVLELGAEIEVLSTGDQSSTMALELVGNAFSQDIYGNAGSNLLQGGGGDDYLIGLGGDDSYLVDGQTDRIVEILGGGRDAVYARSNYRLEAGAQIEVLSAINQAATTGLELVGNEYNQDIYGNAGNNLLQGGGGNDFLVGLTGDDQYIVLGNNDRVVEVAGQGRDVVYTKGDYTLDVTVSVEILSAADQTATTAMRLTGSSQDQEIYGNAGANVLDGGGGTDYMGGLGGNDTYFVSGAGDHILEAAGAGRDVVYARASYTLEANQDIEVLASTQQTATSAMNLTGNNLANEIYGNNGTNTINGGAGSDFLMGFGGVDIFAFTTALGATNVDQIIDFSVADDTIALDDAVFTGLATGVLAAGAFVNGSAAADADDRVLYNSVTGQILFDADGNGAGVAVLFATVSAGTVLTANDFTVI